MHSGEGEDVDLQQALAEVETRALSIEMAMKANSAWLTLGFLADEAFTPQSYVERAEQQRNLERALFALNELLLSDVTLEEAA